MISPTALPCVRFSKVLKAVNLLSFHGLVETLDNRRAIFSLPTGQTAGVRLD